MALGEENIILGIDPGTRLTGYGIIRLVSGKPSLIDFGSIRPNAKATPSERYLHIFQGIEELITLHHPEAIAVETQFMHKNAQSAMKLGIVKGLVILAAAQKKIPLYEYAPRKAKQAVVGNGSASKEQVQKMIQLLLSLKTLPQPEDAADALALALCHSHAKRFAHV